MKIKNMIAAILCGVLVIGAAGCQQTTPANPETGVEAENEASVETPDTQNPLEDTRTFLFDDGRITVMVEFDQETWTLEEPVGMAVVITNNTEQDIVWVKGSGSNLIPDALQLTLGELAPMFRPVMMTSDYQLDTLEPGVSLYLDCPYAPYTPNEENLMIGTDKGIDFFQSDDFTPAASGVVEGSLSFTYQLLPENSDPLTMFAGLEEEEQHVVSGEFFTTIA